MPQERPALCGMSTLGSQGLEQWEQDQAAAGGEKVEGVPPSARRLLYDPILSHKAQLFNCQLGEAVIRSLGGRAAGPRPWRNPWQPGSGPGLSRGSAPRIPWTFIRRTAPFADRYRGPLTARRRGAGGNAPEEAGPTASGGALHDSVWGNGGSYAASASPSSASCRRSFKRSRTSCS